MPVVATTEGRREFARRRYIGIAVQDVTDLVRIFLVDAGEGEFGESFRCGRIKYGSTRVLGGESEQGKQNQCGG